jgi:hypothetical protein
MNDNTNYTGGIGEIGANELVFNTDNENGVYSGGFNVNSIMMKTGFSPIMTLNTQNGGGDTNKVSDLFDSLVIPHWLLSHGSLNKIGGEYKDHSDEDNSDDDIDDDLHDKLVGLVKEHENIVNKQRQNKNKKTKKTQLNKINKSNKKNGTKRNSK